MRPRIAFFIAPVPIVIVFAVVAISHGGRPSDAVLGTIVCVAGAWLLQLFPGLQLAAWLRLNKNDWWRYVGTGVLLYSMPVIVGAGIDTARALPPPPDAIMTFGSFALAGAVAGLTGWLVMRTHDQRAIDLEALSERFE